MGGDGAGGAMVSLMKCKDCFHPARWRSRGARSGSGR